MKDFENGEGLREDEERGEKVLMGEINLVLGQQDGDQDYGTEGYYRPQETREGVVCEEISLFE